ncbi:hypothetical protein ABEB36_005557 [Hypothenemus hampei]|uniref:Uncharacterized protein n=1 Tax=Hypothenemus hampei TaxID=57062 RepID=A0ABD1EYN4_HYPHA
MSTVDCEVVGTGDGKLKNSIKSDTRASKAIAKSTLLEIVNNAVDVASVRSNSSPLSVLEKIPIETLIGKPIKDTKEKSAAPLTGTGDQRSNEALEIEETIIQHPPVEKKNRLMDLVKNSKQAIAKIIMSDSKIALQEKKKEVEKIVEVIDLDCVQPTDLPFKSNSGKVPEEVGLRHIVSHEILASTPFQYEDMEELSLSKDDSIDYGELKRMTLPAISGGNAKAVFLEKCRTLKREATNFKKKKWYVGGKLANFFKKKKKSDKEETILSANNLEKECQKD